MLKPCTDRYKQHTALNIMYSFFATVFASLLVLIYAQQPSNNCNTKNTPANFVYEDLRCDPKYNEATGCLLEYDCSHIYNKPLNQCLLRGKLYKPGEEPSSEIGAESRCDHATCTCAESGYFECLVPSDSCAEWWVPEFVKPGCYLTYELNRCCSNGQLCPPFDGNIKCEVNGVTYEEGKLFEHPTQTCTQCVCQKGFEGKLHAPFCQKMNCTTELLYSTQIRDFCAPYYTRLNQCCPSSWICPSDKDVYIPAQSEPPKGPQCQFGDRKIRLGEKIERPSNAPRYIDSCECISPPYLTCIRKLTQ